MDVTIKGRNEGGGISSGAVSETGAVSNIESTHRNIHTGISFTAYYVRTTAANTGDRTGLYIKTPATTVKEGHLIVSYSASLGTTFLICEAPTLTANIGTHAGVIYNRNRNSAIVSTVFDNATSAAVNKFTTLDEAEFAAGGWSDGTVLRTAPLLTGSGPFAAGGAARGTQEYILKGATKYVFYLITTQNAATLHNILIDWYEE